jgi:hypothetical protein
MLALVRSVSRRTSIGVNVGVVGVALGWGWALTVVDAEESGGDTTFAGFTAGEASGTDAPGCRD